MNKNAIIPIKVCPDGKELNPITGKTCLKKCKEGTERNLLTAKCDKINKGKPGRKPNKSPAKKMTPKKISLSPEEDIIYEESSNELSSIQSVNTEKSSSQDKDFSLYYPDLDDPEFTSKISNNKEFLIHKIPDFPIIKNVKDLKEVFGKEFIDEIMANFHLKIYEFK